MFNRISKVSTNNSFFLLGPRGTGKSTLLRDTFPGAETIDLLDPETETELSRAPQLLRERVLSLPKQPQRTIVIDEVQKVPALLDVVHQIVEMKLGIVFALTGSSARKLKRGQANLLAGRAFVHALHPLTHVELGERFDLDTSLAMGSMPRLFELATAQDQAAFLRAYAHTYFREEIVVEQLIRKVEPFRHFLEIAAQHNATIVNFASIAKDTGVDPNTIQSYFQILEDTLVGLLLPPYHASVRKRQRKNPKFYFFDPGVKRALDRTLTVPLLPQTYAYGQAFEHWVVLEAHRLNDYRTRDFRFSYLRTQADVEIDLVVERPGMPIALVEIKSTEHVRDDDLRALRSMLPAFGNAEAFCLCKERKPRLVDGITVLGWREGLAAIGL